MGQMTEARRGEIALLVVEKLIMEKGIPAPAHFRRSLGNEAKELGISMQEMEDFYTPFLPKLIGTLLNKKNVSLETE